MPDGSSGTSPEERPRKRLRRSFTITQPVLASSSSSSGHGARAQESASFEYGISSDEFSYSVSQSFENPDLSTRSMELDPNITPRARPIDLPLSPTTPDPSQDPPLTIDSGSIMNIESESIPDDEVTLYQSPLDPIPALLDKLKIPCSTFKIITGANDPIPNSTDDGGLEERSTASVPSLHPPTTILSNSQSNKSRKSRSSMFKSSLPTGNLTQASKVTEDQMEDYCAWEFLSQPHHKDRKAKLPEDEFTTSNPLRDIYQPPKMTKIDGTFLPLHRKIALGLSIKKTTIDKLILYLPEDWHEALDSEEPDSIPIPRPYCDYLPLPKWRTATDNTSIIMPQSQPEADQEATNEDDTTQSQLVVEESQDDIDDTYRESTPAEYLIYSESSQSQPKTLKPTEERKLQCLMESHPFPNDASREEKEAVALEFEKAVREANGPYHEFKLNKTLAQCIKGMPQLDGYVKWVDIDNLKGHVLAGAGDVTVGEGHENGDWASQHVIHRFLESLGAKPLGGEGATEKNVGSYLIGLFCTYGDFEERHNTSMPFPDQLMPIGISPFPDIHVRATISPTWPIILRPVLFAGESKDIEKYDGDTKVQLACALHATLIVLILYYLDNRPSLDAPCPHWLFLYGVEYVDDGLKIYAHYPRYIDNESGWGFISVLLSQAFTGIFKKSPVDKSVKMARAIAALYHIRQHSIFLSQKLQEWENAPNVLNLLTK